MCVIELEPCEVWTVKTQRARLPHTCACCKRTIQPGERYTSVFSIFEGEQTYECACSQCWTAQETFSGAHDGTISHPSYFPIMLDECMLDGDDETEQRWIPMREAISAKWGTAATST